MKMGTCGTARRSDIAEDLGAVVLDEDRSGVGDTAVSQGPDRFPGLVKKKELQVGVDGCSDVFCPGRKIGEQAEDEMRGQEGRILRPEDDTLLQGKTFARFLNIAFGCHALENIGLSAADPLAVAVGIEKGRRVGEGGQERRLGQ